MAPGRISTYEVWYGRLEGCTAVGVVEAAGSVVEVGADVVGEAMLGAMKRVSGDNLAKRFRIEV